MKFMKLWVANNLEKTTTLGINIVYHSNVVRRNWQEIYDKSSDIYLINYNVWHGLKTVTSSYVYNKESQLTICNVRLRDKLQGVHMQVCGNTKVVLNYIDDKPSGPCSESIINAQTAEWNLRNGNCWYRDNLTMDKSLVSGPTTP